MHSTLFKVIVIKIIMIITLISFSPLQAMEKISLKEQCNSWVTSLKGYIDKNDNALLTLYFDSIVAALTAYDPIEKLEAYLMLLKKTKQFEQSVLINKLCEQLYLICENNFQETPIQQSLIIVKIQKAILQLADHHNEKWINTLRQKYCGQTSESSKNSNVIVPPLINIPHKTEEKQTNELQSTSVDFDIFNTMEEILREGPDQEPIFLDVFATIKETIYKQDPLQQIIILKNIFNEFRYSTPLVAARLHDFRKELKALYYHEESTPMHATNNN